MINRIPQSPKDFGSWSFSYIYLGCVAIMIGILAVDHAFPLGVAIGTLYIIPVLLSLSSSRNWFVFAVAGISTLLVIIGFFLSPPGGELWKVIFNRSIAVVMVWITTFFGVKNRILIIRREKAVREREEALDDVKVLRGLLPICAWCKNVRSDKGYWTKIEAYISANSDASFSHGICPECLKKHYPEVFKKRYPDLNDVTGPRTGKV